MTSEEAKEVICEMVNISFLGEKEVNALHIAYQALEKQMLKKPIEITRNEHSTRIIGYGCPTCHKDVVGSGFHCWNCGQALDWSKNLNSCIDGGKQ